MIHAVGREVAEIRVAQIINLRRQQHLTLRRREVPDAHAGRIQRLNLRLVQRPARIRRHRREPIAVRDRRNLRRRQMIHAVGREVAEIRVAQIINLRRQQHLTLRRREVPDAHAGRIQRLNLRLVQRPARIRRHRREPIAVRDRRNLRRRQMIHAVGREVAEIRVAQIINLRRQQHLTLRRRQVADAHAGRVQRLNLRLVERPARIGRHRRKPVAVRNRSDLRRRQVIHAIGGQVTEICVAQIINLRRQQHLTLRRRQVADAHAGRVQRLNLRLVQRPARIGRHRRKPIRVRNRRDLRRRQVVGLVGVQIAELRVVHRVDRRLDLRIAHRDLHRVGIRRTGGVSDGHLKRQRRNPGRPRRRKRRRRGAGIAERHARPAHLPPLITDRIIDIRVVAAGRTERHRRALVDILIGPGVGDRPFVHAGDVHRQRVDAHVRSVAHAQLERHVCLARDVRSGKRRVRRVRVAQLDFRPGGLDPFIGEALTFTVHGRGVELNRRAFNNALVLTRVSAGRVIVRVHVHRDRVHRQVRPVTHVKLKRHVRVGDSLGRVKRRTRGLRVAELDVRTGGLHPAIGQRVARVVIE
ncbi:hypothetical protein RAS1_00010 [Phycisphaerae bacterium RAS1]|nr:hypothetical protein RAS1_00010 [Phycisphaerae bacterium RAS1]